MQQLVESFGLVYSPDYLKPLFRIVSLYVVGLITLKLVDSGLRRLVSIVPGNDATGSRRLERRAETIRHIVRSFGRAVLGSVLVIYIAAELGFPLGALITTAGIAGLAIGFGAQSLVKDVIAGFFVLLEDQYGVGDTVRIAGLEGIVEEMTLRVTVLRSGSGEVHVVPNGTIQTVSVLSRDWRRAVVDMSVAHKEELGRVFAILSKVGEQLAKDMPDDILDKPVVTGVDKLVGTGTKVRVGVKVKPSRQVAVEYEWRRRIKEAFEREGVQLVAE
jgi:moderate conductance mechanosensitive channel